MTGLDGKTQLQMLAFKSPKIRLLRSMAIENETMQVLLFLIYVYKFDWHDLCVYDLPRRVKEHVALVLIF